MSELLSSDCAHQTDRVAELEAEVERLRECLLWLQARHNGGLMRAKIDAALSDKGASHD